MASFNRSWIRWFREDSQHLPVLTGVRGWAALWVALYHVWGLAGHPDFSREWLGVRWDATPLVSMGIAGVTIFFVLSGFLLALPFSEWQAGMRARPALPRYFFRRVMRVFPAYYIQLAILVLIAAWIPGQPGLESFGSLLRHMLMLFTPPPIGTTPLNGVWWTLPIEFSFYLALPFLAFLLRPVRWWWLVPGCLAIMMLWRHATVVLMAGDALPARVVAAYQLPGSMDAFGAGMLASMLYVQRAHWPKWLLDIRHMDRLASLGMMLMLVAIYWLPGKRQEYWNDNPIFYLWTPALSLAVVALILSGACGSRLMQRVFGNGVMVYLGLISYSLYLWHFPVLHWIMASGWLRELPGFIDIFMLAGPSILLVATLSYVFVERPGMHLRSGALKARQ
jgi:peptidoglycan/LPS O-acetylase OafA/YrhL